ncbi:MAG: hypothetical protein K6T26_05975, partial [Alicyclobacillus sp.]|nr:hypothetical protein [Alicyclobacillus sp.]
MSLRGRGFWVLATNALDPVCRGEWLEPGAHVNSIQGREIDRVTLQRADKVVVRARVKPTHWGPPGFEPLEVQKSRSKDVDIQDKMVTLGEVVTGAWQRDPAWITVFGGGGTGGSGGLGVQFAAVAHLIWQKAQEHHLGYEINP